MLLSLLEIFMKSICLMICLSSFLFFQCERKDKPKLLPDSNLNQTQMNQTDSDKDISKMDLQKNTSMNANLSNTAMTNQKKAGDIEYQISVKQDGENILINYQVINKGKKSYLLFNRGISPNCEEGKAFVEQSENEIIEIAQKLYQPPENIECPLLESQIEQGVSTLKSGQTVSEDIKVSLPLKYDTPNNYCYLNTNLPKISESAKKVRFCLGYIETELSKTKIEGCKIKEWNGKGDQKLLCSEVIELK